MKILSLKKIPHYKNTNLTFLNEESAQKYTEFLKKEFDINKVTGMEFLSKRKKKNLMFSRPKKYLLTRQGSKFLLWEEMG